MNTAAENSYVNFRLQVDGTQIAGITSLATDFDYDDWFGSQVATSWNAHFTMYPIVVTPGVSTTINIQWRRDGIAPSVAYCSATTLQEVSHRSLTIFD
jgi:hypothetical protein